MRTPVDRNTAVARWVADHKVAFRRAAVRKAVARTVADHRAAVR